MVATVESPAKVQADLEDDSVCGDCGGEGRFQVFGDVQDEFAVPDGTWVTCGCMTEPVTWADVEALMVEGDLIDLPPSVGPARWRLRPLGFCAGWSGERPHVVSTRISHAPAVFASAWTVLCGHCQTVLVSFGDLDTPAYERSWYELVDQQNETGTRHGGDQVGRHAAPTPGFSTLVEVVHG